MMNGEIIHSLYQLLRVGGLFILESRNPQHPKIRKLQQEYRDWEPKGEGYLLYEQVFNPALGRCESREVLISPERDEITITDFQGCEAIDLHRMIGLMQAAGFGKIWATDARGNRFEAGRDQDIYQVWLYAVK